jgi:hypothetical protein
MADKGVCGQGHGHDIMTMHLSTTAQLTAADMLQLCGELFLGCLHGSSLLPSLHVCWHEVVLYGMELLLQRHAQRGMTLGLIQGHTLGSAYNLPHTLRQKAILAQHIADCHTGADMVGTWTEVCLQRQSS